MTTETISRMLETSPSQAPFRHDALVRCIEECFACAESCNACADACLGEEDVNELVSCIRLNLDCAAVCGATGAVMSRQTAFDPALARPLLEACAAACDRCAAECERHAGHHEHCRVCAEACRRCETACREALSALGA